MTTARKRNRSSDLETAAKVFTGVGPEDIVAAFSIDFPPVPKGRPRLGKNGNVYTPKATSDAEVRVAWHFRAVAKGHTPDLADYGVRAVFHTSRTADVDNLLKLVLDGLNGICWVDDRQVVDVWASKRRATRGTEQTDLLIWRAP